MIECPEQLKLLNFKVNQINFRDKSSLYLFNIKFMLYSPGKILMSKGNTVIDVDLFSKLDKFSCNLKFK